VPSLISGCAAAKMFRGEDFAHYPRGARAHSERPLIPTRPSRPFPSSFVDTRRGRAARPDPPPQNLQLARGDVADTLCACREWFEGYNSPTRALMWSRHLFRSWSFI
jgi:hypothetical protein